MNVHPAEDEFVLPFIKANRYTFIPLKGNDKWAEEHYKVRGTPQNFLIDARGKVMFKPRVHSKEQQDMLVGMVEGLLSRIPKAGE